MAVVLVLTLASLIGPAIIKRSTGYAYDVIPKDVRLNKSFAPFRSPEGKFSWTHPMGTDNAGRDILARVLSGGQISLMVALIATLVSLVIGVSYGAVAGYLGGRLDDLMMRIVDVLYSLPYVIIVIVLLALLPAMPYGVNTNHLGIPGALACSVTPTTLLHFLTDLADSLERQGVRKLVLLNGHGGNELKPLTRELHHRTGVFLCVCDWFRMARDVYPDLFERPGEHADEVETSLGLAFFPELVHPELADAGAARPTKLEAVNRGWISITRPWHLVTTNTGLGDPRAATPDKGRRLMDVLVERLGDFLVELAGTPMDERFPY